MIVTITANLPDDKAMLLALEKGYNRTISQKDLETNTSVEIENPMSCFEFIKNLYVGKIQTDVTDCFVNFEKKQREEEERKQVELIRQQVEQSINSTFSI